MGNVKYITEKQGRILRIVEKHEPKTSSLNQLYIRPFKLGHTKLKSTKTRETLTSRPQTRKIITGELEAIRRRRKARRPGQITEQGKRINFNTLRLVSCKRLPAREKRVIDR